MTVEPIKVVRTVRAFEGGWCDDGYEFMGRGRAAGWRAVPAWGREGWDCGSWPLVVVLFREWSDEGIFQRAVYVEGDVEVETYATAEARDAATDQTAAFYLRLEGLEESSDPASRRLGEELKGWEQGDPVPELLRGPYRARATA